MKPKLFIAAAGLALLLAYPVSLALRSRDDIIQSQQRVNHTLQIKVEQLQKAQSKPVSLVTPTKQAVITPPVVVSSPPTQPVAAPVQQAPAPVAHIAAVGCSSYLSEFQKYAWSVTTAVAICQAESGGNPYAVSPTCDRGLMQVNCIHADLVSGNLSALYDPATNIAVAYKIYSGAGWSAWTTYTSGKYLKYE
jgi:soluble lytic murein transglycosylase-like protein